MTALTNVSTAISASATEADLKTFLSNLYNYLAGLFGTDGIKATAIATLGTSPFPAGTAMLFAQTSAPTGWTKSTAHNDKTLRVVSGTAGSGGSVAFSSVFGRTSVDASSLSIAQLAAHSHTYQTGSASSGGGASGSGTNNSSTSSVGSGSTHSHGLDLRVQYLDVIVATKA